MYGFTARADNYGVWGDTNVGIGVLGYSAGTIGRRARYAAKRLEKNERSTLGGFTG